MRNVAIAIAGLYLVGSASAPAGAQVERLDELLKPYRAIETVHLRATATVTVGERAGPVRGGARIEYWDTGRRYRARCHTDPRLRHVERFPLAQDADFAFNGKFAQHWDLEQNLLSIGRRQSDLLPIALPNPFVLPVAFLLPDSRDCRGCKVGLEEIRSADLAEIDAEGLLYWDHGSGEAVRLEATPLGGRALDVTVEIGDVDGVPVAERIERRREGGRQIVELSGHRPVGDDREVAMLFPSQIVVSDFGLDANGEEELQVRTEFAIDAITLDERIPRRTFSIDGDRTTAVYDRDQKRFLRRPGAEDDGEPLPGIRLDRRDR